LEELYLADPLGDAELAAVRIRDMKEAARLALPEGCSWTGHESVCVAEWPYIETKPVTARVEEGMQYRQKMTKKAQQRTQWQKLKREFNRKLTDALQIADMHIPYVDDV
jgi:hypothetical protein